MNFLSGPPRLEWCPGKVLVGCAQTMSLAADQTRSLWSRFMPRRNEIPGADPVYLVSASVWPPGPPQPHTLYQKWATKEAPHFSSVPEGLEVLTVPPGWYAVFPYQGRPQDAGLAFRWIFMEWLPASEWVYEPVVTESLPGLPSRSRIRPRMEMLGPAYYDPEGLPKEDLWIPVRPANPL